MIILKQKIKNLSIFETWKILNFVNYFGKKNKNLFYKESFAKLQSEFQNDFMLKEILNEVDNYLSYR